MCVYVCVVRARGQQDGGGKVKEKKKRRKETKGMVEKKESIRPSKYVFFLPSSSTSIQETGSAAVSYVLLPVRGGGRICRHHGVPRFVVRVRRSRRCGRLCTVPPARFNPEEH
jgi:hypothetical protein